MIKEERLNKLIEEKATIYEAKYGNINPVYLGNEIRFINYKYGVISFKPRIGEKYRHNKYIKNLFETKEEGEWHKEFGCIERTERLELPTWEENKPIECIFSTPNRSSYCLKTRVKTGYSIDKENPYIIRIFKFGESDNFIDFEFTKENYTLACRKVRELFLGEIQV